jgi:hypothetical protein
MYRRPSGGHGTLGLRRRRAGADTPIVGRSWPAISRPTQRGSQRPGGRRGAPVLHRRCRSCPGWSKGGRGVAVAGHPAAGCPG